MGSPTFMIIGAAKCGTTSIFNYLAQHPDIYGAPGKEPNYFALAGRSLPLPGPGSDAFRMHHLYQTTVTDWDAYRRMFDGSERHVAAGEASVRYLFCPAAPERIHKALPQTRLIAILRDPAARIFSHYNMNVQLGLEPLPIHAALRAEARRTAAGWGWDWRYTAVSRYAEQLDRYYALFPRDQIAVYFYEDFARRPRETLAAMFRHIGVSDDFAADMSERGMVPYRPRIAALNHWLLAPDGLRRRLTAGRKGRLTGPIIERLRNWNMAPAPKLDPALRAELTLAMAGETSRTAVTTGLTPPWGAS